MKKHLIVTSLFLISCAKPNQAQEPRWELLMRDLMGVIAVDPANSDVIYVGSRSSGKPGMWKTTDGGQSWNQYKNGWGIGLTSDILIDPTNPNVLLAGGGPFVGILKSVDGGQNWFRADTGLVPDHHGYMVGSLALDNQRRIFYAAHQGIFGGVLRSSDGVRWQNLTPSYPFDTMKIIVDESTGVLYVAGFSGVWKSLDGGNTWMPINNGLNINPRTIWHVVKLKHSNTLYAATASGIYKTINGGNNWLSVNDSITAKLSFRGGLVIAEKDTNTVYAGTVATLNPAQPGGIYLSRNGGQSWALYNLGLPDSVLDFHVLNLFLDNRANVLYANISLIFPYGRSEEHLYRLRDAVITAVRESRTAKHLARFALHSYPNPFNNQTILLCSVHQTGRVVLRLFDILGKEVMVLLNEQHGPGDYRVPWDGTNTEGKKLPSGIYLARLQVGTEVKTTKLLLLP